MAPCEIVLGLEPNHFEVGGGRDANTSTRGELKAWTKTGDGCAAGDYECYEETVVGHEQEVGGSILFGCYWRGAERVTCIKYQLFYM